MATRRTRTRSKHGASHYRSSRRKTARQWGREEIAFMRKYYRKFETSWVARQLGRTVYSVRYKAVDLSLHKANPSIWKGNCGPVNAFRKNKGTRKPSRTTTRRKTSGRRSSRTRSWRAHSTRRTR